MNEEEKQAIEYIRNCLDDEYDFKNATRQKDKEVYKIILELIKKQQKEIEKRLKEIDSLYKMMTAKDERIEGLTELVNKYNDMKYIRKIEELYISKDKIREFMKDYQEGDMLEITGVCKFLLGE